MQGIIDGIRRIVRRGVRAVAAALNRLSGGRLRPNAVTISGVLLHVPLAMVIASRRWPVLAAAALVVFGLFDTLDGELARLQKRASTYGMLLDASTDRFKEAMLFTGVAYALATGPHPGLAAWAAAALGASLSVSYVKAKGEMAVAAQHPQMTPGDLNRLFSDGLLTFEVRMTILAAGVATGQLAPAAVLIAVLAGYTALQRLVTIGRKLRRRDDKT